MWEIEVDKNKINLNCTIKVNAAAAVINSVQGVNYCITDTNTTCNVAITQVTIAKTAIISTDAISDASSRTPDSVGAMLSLCCAGCCISLSRVGSTGPSCYSSCLVEFV